MDKIIAFFPAYKRHYGVGLSLRESGYVLKVEGDMIESDFAEANSRNIDDFELELCGFPLATGIYVFESEHSTTSKLGYPRYNGSWRKATEADLKGLIR